MKKNYAIQWLYEICCPNVTQNKDYATKTQVKVVLSL